MEDDLDEPVPGFDLLEGTDGRRAWLQPVGAVLMAAGAAVLVGAFSLLLRRTAEEVPSQSPVPLPDPLAIFGAFALALVLLCAGAVAWTLPNQVRPSLD